MPDTPELKVIENPEKYFINRGLFSDHYLQSRLPKRPEWQTGQNMVDFRQKLLALYESQKPHLSKYNEAQTEQKFIKPILDLLGYSDCYVVQPAANTGTPDYALFPNKIAAENAHTKQGETDYSQCIGIADAKYWERNLDIYKHNKKDTFTHKNPSFQIVNYLTGTKITWGILTNGRHWRLYTSKAHMPIANYYEVDIVKLLESPLETLKYFYLFFRKEALLTDANNKTLLDHIFEDSNEYAAELENNIKERAYEVVQLICQGFAANFKPDQVDEPTLKQIYDNSLTFLYRLLFVFYAEARDLLPLISNQSYRDNYSIRSIVHKIEDAETKRLPFSSKSTIYYQSLINLFNLINSGDPSLNIPEYNGGLFDSAEHPFLNSNTIADSYLVKTLRHLAWVLDKELGFEVMVDYNTLSERHLGSIYEGLLEFKPAIAEEDLVEIKDKNGTKYAPAKDNPTKTIICRKNDLYLVNDKGERKATGSYYTPEYIVNYIVGNTLDSLVSEAQVKVKALKPQVEVEIKKWQELKEQKQGLEPLEKYDKEIAKQAKRMLEPYLSLKVLDPAMGSGHFLTRATDFIAMAIASDPSIESSADLDEEAEIIYYRRRVVESCIYGVDLNPLAVELAKLTLWLSTMTKAKPLSFLNHHLRCGNSLIGAKVADLDQIPEVTSKKKKKKIDPSRAPVKIGLFGWAFNQKLIVLLKNRAMIAEFPSETLQDIHNKERWEQDFQQNAKRCRLLADIWASTYFGSTVVWDEYNELAENLQSNESVWVNLLQKTSIEKALNIAKERYIFHWELEYPEVFYDEQGNRKENAGFDAIVGNPPYERTKYLVNDLEAYNNLFETAHGSYDIYIIFFEKALSLLKPNGKFGYITSNKYLVADYGSKLREKLCSENIITELVDLTECPSTFPNILVSAILTFASNSPQTSTKIAVIKLDDLTALQKLPKLYVLANNGTYEDQDFTIEIRNTKKLLDDNLEQINLYLFGSKKTLVDKMYTISNRLGVIAELRTGIMGFEYWSMEPLVKDGIAPKSDELKLLSPGLIDRYENLWGMEPVDLYKKNYNLPLLKKDPKRINDNTWTFFQKRKLIVRGVARKLSAIMDEEGFALLVAIHGIISEKYNHGYLAALLNSKLLDWLHVNQYYGARIPQGSLRYPVLFVA